ncbi:hypothetical protein AA0114_g10631 [Alternaria tenuissima]|uniref:Uncharacterized protein n=1 Tax=Alternaria tenuissima TaxID=119927 RepID=A0A4Q4M3E8_9PLEO|nr:hypothetical protein AA0114_g10631 [Alternaria tenuissima]
MAPKQRGKKHHISSNKAGTPERSQQPAVPQTPGLSQGVSNLTVQDPVTPLPVPKEDHIAQTSQALVRFRADVISLIPDSPRAKDAFEQLVQDLSLKAPRDQRHTLDNWFTQVSSALDSAYDLIMRVGEHCESMQPLMDEYDGVKGFRDHYPIFKEVKDSKQKRKDEMVSAVKSIKSNEPGLIEDCITPCMPRMLTTHTALMDMSYVLKRMDANNASYFLNQLALHRITTPGRGKDKHVNAQDWANLKTMCKEFCEFAESNIFFEDEDPPQLSAERAYELEQQLYAAGLTQDDLKYSPQKLRPYLRANERVEDFWTDLFMSMADHVTIPTTTKPCTTLGKGLDAHTAGFDAQGMMRHPKFGIAIPKSTYVAAIENGEETIAPLRNLDIEMQSIGARTRRARSHTGTSTDDRISMEREAGQEVIDKRNSVVETFLSEARRNLPMLPPPVPRRSSLAPKATPAYRQTANALDLAVAEEDRGEDPDAPEESAAILASTCPCTNNGSLLLGLVRKLYPTKATVKDPSRFQLIEEWYREITTEKEGTVVLNYDRVCFLHRGAIASIQGVFRRAMNKQALNRVLLMLYRYRNKWGYVRSHEQGNVLFVKKLRGARQDDDMMSYRYRPRNLAVPSIDWVQFRKKMVTMQMDKNYDSFQSGGNIGLPIFNYLVDDPEISVIIDESFKMYQYHQREIGGKPNLGWLRNMYHSLIQQAVRVDLVYWMYYSVFRGEHTMISYPYYAKYATPGDKTYFRHVDCNVEWAHREGKGRDMIQGSVSLDDEDLNNCTQVLRGFHNILPQYLSWRAASGSRESQGLIEAWDDKDHWPAEIASQHPTVKWVNMPCKKGMVRISNPIMPHGSTGPATIVRRTILPWFVMVRNGVMENPAMGTYEEICAAHRNLTSTSKSPSGHPNKYGGIKWAFPADLHIDLRSWIQKALVGQCDWDNRLVQLELINIMVNDEQYVMDFIRTHRNHVKAQIKELWETQKLLERKAFAADESTGAPCRSYFDNKGVHPKEGAWASWDSDFTQSDALSRLEDELALEPDERYHFRLSNQSSVGSPTHTHSQIRSRSNTIVSTDTAVPPTPTPAQRRSERVAKKGQQKK